jgi:NitT/TauT family transport system substrate-binding protein
VPWRNGAVTPGGDAGFVFMAQHGGFATREGIALSMSTQASDPLLLKSLLAGEIESYEGSPGNPMMAAANGADVRVVACHWHKVNYVFWTRPPVASMQDLRGRGVGVTAPGSSPELFVRAVMLEAGVTANQVTFVVSTSPAEQLDALANGSADSAVTPNEFRDRARHMGFDELTNARQSARPFLRRCFFARTSTIARRSDALAHFLAAEIASYEYALSHRDAEITLTREILKPDPAATEPELAFDDAVERHSISADFAVPLDNFIWLDTLLVRLGDMQPGYDARRFIDTRALALALKLGPQLATTKPK